MIFLFAKSEVYATSMTESELICPVCGEKCSGWRLLSTNTLGGQDRDFLNRAFGSQPILFTPVTCKKCLYSAYSDDFEKNVTEKLKSKILTDKILKISNYSSSYSETGKDRFPAWVRHDLIAQLMKSENADEEKLAWQYMAVAWAVRFEENPIETLMNQLSENERDWITDMIGPIEKKYGSIENRALIEIKIAKYLLENIDDYSASDQKTVLIFSGYMLKSHGENNYLMSSEKLFSPGFSEKEWNEISKKLVLSIDLEKKYQRQAISHYKNLINKAGDDEKKAVFTYLTGELYRRLGEYKNAYAYFSDAVKIKNVPAWLVKYANEQKIIDK